MSRLKLSENKTHFELDSKPFFLLSDTEWAAFQKLEPEDFREFVIRRARQGFNAIQFIVLPCTHDNSPGEKDMHPFHFKDGKYDFYNINDAYFDRAEKMLSIMKEYGLIPFLHLFWVNYIPETWGEKSSPDTVMPYECLEPIAEYIINRFKKYEPIYSVSGDTYFETELVVKYYKTILDVLYRLDPEGLTTLHIGPDAIPPEELCAHPQYHFYAYQSGHNNNLADPSIGQENMLRFSKMFLENPHKKPVMNTEPCYEGLSFAFEYGRFGAFHVRKAIWQSLLTGATLGVSYGAHGVWQMHRHGEKYNNAVFAGMPYSRFDALHFEGAWDAGYSKWLFENYNMTDIVPYTGSYKARSQKLCCAAKEGLRVAYLPYNDDFTFCEDLSDYDIKVVCLENKRIIIPEVKIENGETIITKSICNEDILIIAKKKT